MRKPTLEELRPIFTVAGVVLNTAEMVDKGIKPTFQHLLLPSLATTYGGSIIMNSINNQFSITPKAFFTYLVGFILSIYLYSNRIFLCLVQELPLLSKFLSCIELVDSSDKTRDIIVNQVAGYFVGTLVKKLVLRRTMKIKKADLLNLVVLNTGIYVIRTFRLPHLSVAFAVYSVSLFNRIKNFIVQNQRTRKNAGKSRQPILHTPMSKLPRRRASVANMLEVKNKEL